MSNIQNMSLEDIMGERFGRYSKYIIQERALPDIRDGLKPVQRRILYSMNKDGNTFEKGYRKSAKSVGNIMGNFHPHGDSSIYDAMVRMSQDWKNREILVEMHGNNGSMDGDPPAAMRYTEARLSEIAGYLLQDIEKNTVSFAWNFDDTEKEPTVLPAAFPNLLVNGSSGISAGYATDIPPHNLSEVIDAVVYMIDHPKASLEKLMEFLPGPDFPTGGIIQGADEIKKAYETGKGRVVVRSRTEIEELKGGKQQIIVTEIPYEVNKAVLVKKIDDVRVNNKVPGIVEVRDESDRTGLRIAIELKKDADSQTILNYLLKYTDLQVNYNFNMVAIDHFTPRQVGLQKILSSYISHRKDIIIERSKFDKAKAEKRLHIVEGLIRVLSILDEIIALIRSSDNKADAKENLKVSYDFSEEQAEAIVTLQLYRLTNTDIVTLQNEENDLRDLITTLSAIIGDEATMYNVMKRELREVKKKFANPRLSELQAESQIIEIDTASLIAEEETFVSVTRGGYLKRTSPRSFNASSLEEVGKRDDDELIFVKQAKTTEHLLLFTTLGNVIYRPIHELTDLRWKDIGEHLSQTISNFATEEEILYADIVTSFDQGLYVAVTQNGFIKRFDRKELSPWRTYKSKSTKYVKLKDDKDRVVTLSPVIMEDLLLVTKNGYALRFSSQEVPIQGLKSAGVKGINLKNDDSLASAFAVTSNSFFVLTQRGSLKRMAVDDIPQTSRANRGLLVLRELKTKPHRVFLAGGVQSDTSAEQFDLFTDIPEEETNQQMLEVISKTGQTYEIALETLSLSERTSNGSFISDTISDQEVLVARTR
ncbi:TPA: DNA topoisomerase IV subunit A [Streptococcus pyogenes]|uniref:DNA topoisomerase 4 subunit A n=1 Tax=Streptococcus pyogenes serotype M49 (strain NZ131) TaxID=471876 RepID=A0A0H3BWU9_STRPZ|nr:DNA topoisomerase IV subunit A [Streptococcus pyogenes]ESU89453.1 DNA topoisomerase IV, A subunit [Streptococcus pyogenes GA03799]KGE56546.1 DNA topoisomerase IV, A subunit [Streptococcus pyogenes AA216]HER4552563.1 DNA topoisomerase IV subunit A [Streptococcus pyogenes NGAS664]HER4568063.1 DNA topoisomerase IV subunit A [Streptococcus pyogenes NGAS640]HER4606760.1 DNA topoisomerase IV subunit A [Streptococcus pyogenes NGAS532]HER4660770.1 DNA topoisomerase IV subunit A [Streptococcus pyog